MLTSSSEDFRFQLVSILSLSAHIDHNPLTRNIVSNTDKHLSRLAKLGLSSTSFLLKIQTLRIFPEGRRKINIILLLPDW